MGEQQERAISAAAGMTAALQGVSDRLDQVRQDSEDRDAALKRYGHLNRVLICFAAAGLALDIATTGVAVYALGQEHRNAATTSQLHANNVAACQSGNIRTGKQLKALDNILGVGGPPKTPQQAAFIAKAEGFVAAGWSQRDCRAIYALNRP